MHLWIKGRNRLLNDDVRLFVEERLTSKLARYSKTIRSIALSIRDVNGPRGGVDHIICIIVRLKSGGKIVVRQRASNPYSGVPVAIERAVRVLKRRRESRRNALRRDLVAHV